MDKYKKELDFFINARNSSIDNIIEELQKCKGFPITIKDEDTQKFLKDKIDKLFDINNQCGYYIAFKKMFEEKENDK